MFRFRISALPWLPKIWSYTSALSFCIDSQKCEVPLPLCLYCKICEVLLPRFRSALTGKNLKFRFPHMFCQDFQRCEFPLPHFISDWTFKDLQFRFCTFAQSWLQKIYRSASPLTLSSLPNMGSSASTLPFCIDCKRSVVSHFRSAFIPKDVNALLLCLDCQSSAS